MKILLMLSWRNLWRQKRRSMIVISSIALGVLMMLISIAFMNGMIYQMLDNSISTKLGHIAINKKGFFENMKLQTNFYPDESVLAAIRKDKDVVAFSERVKAFAMIQTSESARGVVIMGIYPDKEKNITKINEYTLRDEGGAYLDDPAGSEIMISKSLASKLDVMVGDKVVLIIQDNDKERSGFGFTVKGLFQTPVQEYDNTVVFMGIKQLQTITGLGDNISEITIITKDKDIAATVKRRLINRINDPDLEIMSWKDMAPTILSAINLIDSTMLIFYAIVFITIVFSIANTLVMAIMERFHEIGVMKSIGTRPSYIFFTIMLEALNLGIVGLAVGLVAGIGIILLLGYTGLDFSNFMAAMRNWGVGSIIYPFLKFKDIVLSIVIVELTTMVAAIYPAVKAARIKPLEALHYV